MADMIKNAIIGRPDDIASLPFLEGQLDFGYWRPEPEGLNGRQNSPTSQYHEGKWETRDVMYMLEINQRTLRTSPWHVRWDSDMGRLVMTEKARTREALGGPIDLATLRVDGREVVPISEDDARFVTDKLNELVRDHGTSSRVTWRNINWGTKWSACNTDVVKLTPDLSAVTFDTAWDSPRPDLLREMLSDFEHPYRVESIDEGGAYVYDPIARDWSEEPLFWWAGDCDDPKRDEFETEMNKRLEAEITLDELDRSPEAAR